jgi:guanine nucleotide exchange factor VAV
MSQFLCLKNIRQFLLVCRNKFGLRTEDLFDPNDLFDVKDFKKVIATLSKLSKCPEVRKSRPDILGFPPSNVKLSQDEDYYNTLEDLATKVGIDDEPLYDVQQSAEDPEDIYGEVIYGTAGSVQQTGKPPRRPVPDKEHRPMTKRDYCIKELVETEKKLF